MPILNRLAKFWSGIKPDKRDFDDIEEGAGDLLDEFELKMSDEKLITLKRDWEKVWEKKEPEISEKRKMNEDYWLGNHYQPNELASERPLVDNKIFEALETFLPIATRQNPEPVVAGNTEQGEELAQKVRKMLIYQTERQSLKLRVKKATRFWALYFAGVAKISYSSVQDDIVTQIIRPQKLILDPEATINDDGEYTGEFIGEIKCEKASSLVLRFEKKKSEIKEMVSGKMGTKVTYIEWWTDDFVFWTLKDLVLDKAKNPHWNEESEKEETDEFGKKVKTTVAGNNHFKTKKKPYVFLTVFDIGLSPFDQTSLISQNLALQDLINKRQRQISDNVDDMNNGVVISGEQSGLTMEEATMAMKAVRKGGALYIPNGDARTAVYKPPASPLPSDVFNNLQDGRIELQNIFGVAGSTSGGIKSESTVRGKIITREGDTSRIGGGISVHIEQFTSNIFNWWVQMMYVYYDSPEGKTASIMGIENSREFFELKNTEFIEDLTVGVKDGSLIPKDPLTQRNEAIDLFNSQVMDPITLYEKLDYPNPRKSAERAFMWQAAPQELFAQQEEGANVGEVVQNAQTNQALQEEATRRALQPEAEEVVQQPPQE